MPSYQLSIRPDIVLKTLFGIAILLLVASMLGQTLRFVFDHDYAYGFVPLFNVDNERNIPTFFTVLVALSGAMLLALVAVGARNRGDRASPYWFALAAGFVFLAYDEAFQVHEKLTEPMRALLGGENLGVLHLAWVVPGVVGVCVLGLLFRTFLMGLPATTRRALLTAAALYLGGAIGMEMLDGAYAEAYGADYTYTFLATIEEGLEMSGLIMLVHAMLGHLASLGNRVELNLASRELPQAMPLAQPSLG